MEIKASARYLRISPTKLRLVTQPLKGKKVEEALAVLQFLPQRGARLLRKVVEAAVANAEQRPQIELDTLVIKSIWVDGGPSLKRFQPRAMGRVNRILKRSSHVTVVLAERPRK
ncbi:MAG: 50S ribosomal protein L22 [Deltaproteobacteria bacterium RBG_13_58_19]|nr:MAG: 50S ribosomal protein L22 [Deltaproteobacteria bacterium RBG_13_58_19]